MWVHELELGGEKNMLEAWFGPNHARTAPFKRGAFLSLEREREKS